jgi:nucleoside-diphosphate-sugar epimerase
VRYLITGGSGYVGSRLTEILAARDDVDGVVVLDVRLPARSQPKTTFVPSP